MIKTIGKKKPLKLMWRIILYTPFLYIADGLAWMIIHTAPLIPGLLAKLFFDMISGEAQMSMGLWGLLALVAATALGRIVMAYVGIRIDILFRFKENSLIRRNLLEILMKRPGAHPAKASTGEILNIFRDDADQIENAVDWFLDIMGTLVFAIAAVVILTSINARITLYVFTPLIAVIGAANLASNRIERYRRESREATAEVNGLIGEMFGAVQAVKVSGSEEHIISHFHKLNKKRHKLMLRDTLFTQLLESIFQNTVSLGTGLILLLVSQSMKTGSFSVGDFALFVYYLGFVTDFTQFFGIYIAHYQQTCVSFDRVADIMEETPVEELVKHNPLYMKGCIPSLKNEKTDYTEKFETLSVKGLTYRYPSSGGGIEDISFEIKRGSFTVICGKIGSGKTTILRSLLGLLPTESGEIMWNKRRVDEPGEFFIYPRTSYTAQVPHLISDTVKNNILMGMEEKSVDIDKAIYSAVFDKDIKDLENGLDTVVGPRGVKLSGGQVQRVAAARMFARDPEILIFDDISSALDVETENILWKRIFETKDKTCIVVSNRKTALHYADNIIVLKNGRVEAQGTLEQLIENSEELQQIWA